MATSRTASEPTEGLRRVLSTAFPPLDQANIIVNHSLPVSSAALRDLRHSYSKYLLMNFFYLMKCRDYAIHLTHYWLYYRIIFFEVALLATERGSLLNHAQFKLG